ncbi:MAG TPA: hypothetical protein VIJ25_16410, partial [Methylococcales bacterium]
MTTVSAATPQVTPADKASWTCYDYAVDFAANNPGWGIFTRGDPSGGPEFKANSHMMNYKVLDNGKTLLIHDEM